MDKPEVIKNVGGRPSFRNIARDDQYFNNYYQQTKHDFTCDCGMTLSSKSKARHLKRPIHAKKLEELLKGSSETVEP